MGAELNRIGHDTGGNGTAKAGGHIVAADLGDHLVFDVLQQGGMYIKEGAGIDGQVLHAGICQLVHDHIQHEVTVAQVMVEGNGHTVLHPSQPDHFL